MALTGRFTFRRTMTGKIVLQVEEEVKGGWFGLGKDGHKRRWRDASLMDLAMPEMRALIDLRYKPQFMAQNYYGVPTEETPLAAAVREGHEAAAVAAAPNVSPFPDPANHQPRRTAH